MTLHRPGTTAQAGALLRQLLELPLAEAIDFACNADAETFLPPVGLSDARESAWWQLCDTAFEKYRFAASLPGYRLCLALERSLVSRHVAPDVTDLDDTLDAAKASQCPRWPSGVSRLDDVAGGAYGTEVLGGSPGAGKSTLALDQAVQAAATGWRVCYFDTELSIPNLRGRLDALKKSRVNDYWKAMTEPHRRIHFAGLDTLKDGFGAFCDFVTQRILPTDERVLVVLDHVHDIARGLARGSGSSGAFFRALETIGDAAKTSRRESEGSVAWILVAELNQKGGIRGGQLDYAADLVLSLAKEGDISNVTSLRVVKGREGGDGPYGKFYVDDKRGRLMPLEDRSSEPTQPDPAWEM